MKVKKIKLGAVEGNLKKVSSSAETIKKLQDEKEATLREYGREKKRYAAGDIAGDVFDSLTRAYRRKISTLDKKISALVARSKGSLTTLTGLVGGRVAGRRRILKRLKKIKRKLKRKKKAKKKKKRRIKKAKRRKAKRKKKAKGKKKKK